MFAGMRQLCANDNFRFYPNQLIIGLFEYRLLSLIYSYSWFTLISSHLITFDLIWWNLISISFLSKMFLTVLHVSTYSIVIYFYFLR